MKTLLRNTAINGVSLFILTQLFSGVNISGGFITFVIGGIVLSLMTIILRPILNLIAFPINLITFGLFSFVINAIILYLLTVVIQDIKITAFVFNGFSFAGFVVPSVSLNTLFAYILSSFVLSVTVSFINWLIEK